MRLAKPLSALAASTALAISLPAQAQSCLVEAEMAALSTLILDKATELTVRQCGSKFAAEMPFATAHRDAVLARFDGRRDGAYNALIGKVAPMLAGTKMAAASAAVIDPLVDAMVSEGMSDDVTAENCANMDAVIEAFYPLEDAEIIHAANVMIRRGLARDGEPPFVPCNAR